MQQPGSLNTRVYLASFSLAVPALPPRRADGQHQGLDADHEAETWSDGVSSLVEDIARDVLR